MTVMSDEKDEVKIVRDEREARVAAARRTIEERIRATSAAQAGRPKS